MMGDHSNRNTGDSLRALYASKVTMHMDQVTGRVDLAAVEADVFEEMKFDVDAAKRVQIERARRNYDETHDIVVVGGEIQNSEDVVLVLGRKQRSSWQKSTIVENRAALMVLEDVLDSAIAAIEPKIALLKSYIAEQEIEPELTNADIDKRRKGSGEATA